MKKRDTNAKYMTRNQVASHFEISYMTLLNRINSGMLKPDMKIGKHDFFLRERIEKMSRDDIALAGKNSGRWAMKLPTVQEIVILTKYCLAKISGKKAMEELGVENKQRAGQVMQNIAYRKFYFDLLGKEE